MCRDGDWDGALIAVGETVILLHPPLPLVGVSIVVERGCQQNDSLADGQALAVLRSLPSAARFSRRGLQPIHYLLLSRCATAARIVDCCTLFSRAIVCIRNVLGCP